MKKYSLLIAGAACLLATACKKDGRSAANPATTKNIDAWNAANTSTGFKPLATKDTLFIAGHIGEQNIVIALKQKGAGTYTPSEFKAWFYTTVGQDAVVGKYQLAIDAANTMVITAYDEATHTLRGTFNLTLKSTYRNYDSLPDEIKITNGVINTQLTDVYMDPFR